MSAYDPKNPIVVPIREDKRYRSWRSVPLPQSNAVIIYMMDVSGSMDEQRKELSKRFFILLYLFLTRHYDKIELVFIRHGQPEWDRDGRTVQNPRLTDVGLQQAQVLTQLRLGLVGRAVRAAVDVAIAAAVAEWNLPGPAMTQQIGRAHV